MWRQDFHSFDELLMLLLLLRLHMMYCTVQLLSVAFKINNELISKLCYIIGIYKIVKNKNSFRFQFRSVSLTNISRKHSSFLLFKHLAVNPHIITFPGLRTTIKTK